MRREQMRKGYNNGEDPLDLSIEKWQDIVDGVGINEQASNCALCHDASIRNSNPIDCRGCPIYEKKKIDGCGIREYEEFMATSVNCTTKDCGLIRHCKKCREAGKPMLKLLKELKKQKELTCKN